MKLRLTGLSAVDPLAVPLPHGTEVTTRVERLAPDGERRVPVGAAGRIVRARAGGFDVRVAGVGELYFARDELVPRKVGQRRFAERRAAAWDALRPCVVLEAVVGSRAWGLADARSDTDERGAFALPFAWTCGLAEPPRDLVSSDGSATFWEIGKLVRQALRADPNTLELLFVPSVRATDEIGEWLLAARGAFVSREIFGSFGRYALSQLAKLERAQRLAAHRDVVVAWLREEPAPDLDEVARRLAREVPPAATAPAGEGNARLAAKEYVKQLYRSLHDQGLAAAADFPSLVAYARGTTVELDTARHLRPKNAYNLLRLVATATGWLATGEPQFVVEEPLRSRLLAIKRGEVPLEEVLREAEAMTVALERARHDTKLPVEPDWAAADALLRRIAEELARRWIARTPGPFGVAAPPVPPLEVTPPPPDDDEGDDV